MSTLSYFTTRFPEFSDTEAGLIEMALMEAKQEINKDRWGSLYSAAVGYLAAHKLAISPMGEPSRLEGTNETIYWKEFSRLCRSAHMGALVV